MVAMAMLLPSMNQLLLRSFVECAAIKAADNCVFHNTTEELMFSLDSSEIHQTNTMSDTYTTEMETLTWKLKRSFEKYDAFKEIWENQFLAQEEKMACKDAEITALKEELDKTLQIEQELRNEFTFKEERLTEARDSFQLEVEKLQATEADLRKKNADMLESFEEAKAEQSQSHEDAVARMQEDFYSRLELQGQQNDMKCQKLEENHQRQIQEMEQQLHQMEESKNMDLENFEKERQLHSGRLTNLEQTAEATHHKDKAAYRSLYQDKTQLAEEYELLQKKNTENERLLAELEVDVHQNTLTIRGQNMELESLKKEKAHIASEAVKHRNRAAVAEHKFVMLEETHKAVVEELKEAEKAHKELEAKYKDVNASNRQTLRRLKDANAKVEVGKSQKNTMLKKLQGKETFITRFQEDLEKTIPRNMNERKMMHHIGALKAAYMEERHTPGPGEINLADYIKTLVGDSDKLHTTNKENKFLSERLKKTEERLRRYTKDCERSTATILRVNEMQAHQLRELKAELKEMTRQLEKARKPVGLKMESWIKKKVLQRSPPR